MSSRSRASAAGFRLVSVEDEALAELRYLNAARGGGTVSERLPIQRGAVRGLPPGLDALIATSDLQGVVRPRKDAPSRLLGIAVAELLEELAFDGVIPAAERTGVLLAGDLYSVPDADKRGGHGDVAEVWGAFAPFAWVAGVAGNHDDVSRLMSSERLHLLDTEVIDKGGLRLGGVGYIAGNPEKRGRRAEADQLERLELMAMEGVDILLCHEGPSGQGGGQQFGHDGIRAIVEQHRVPLTLCGHVHWDQAVAEVEGGAILNVDARVVVLVAAE